MEKIPHLRVFVSSPGDITQEREDALKVIKNLPTRPAFRGRVSFQIVTWEDTAMRASLTPQEAINKGLPKPSECDIVVVLLWSRMGTPLTMNGEEFLSGTHWELLNALNSDRPEVRIYHRTEDPNIKPSDLQRQEKLEQYDRVKAFLKSDLFYDSETGSIRRGVNNYTNPEEFRQKFEQHFQDAVLEILKKLEARTKLEEDRRFDAAMPKQVALDKTTELWVQICLPQSPGFKGRLPDIVEGGEEITSEDVEDDKFTLTFPVNPLTSEIEHSRVTITIKAEDFSLRNSQRTLRIHAGKDSGKEIFHLKAVELNNRSRVSVHVYQMGKDGELDTLGSVSLRTRISNSSPGQHIGWNMISLPLSPLLVVNAAEGSALEEPSLVKPITNSPKTTQAKPKIPLLQTRIIPTISPLQLNILSTAMSVFGVLVLAIGAGGGISSLTITAGDPGSNGSGNANSDVIGNTSIELITVGILVIAVVVAINLYYRRRYRRR